MLYIPVAELGIELRTPFNRWSERLVRTSKIVHTKITLLGLLGPFITLSRNFCILPSITKICCIRIAVGGKSQVSSRHALNGCAHLQGIAVAGNSHALSALLLQDKAPDASAIHLGW